MPQPVLVFLRQSLTLKSAFAVCRDKPKAKPVHHLRSATRRMEAMLVLLIMSSDIADLKRKSKSLRRSLRKVRRAAGEVRDLDVHRELLDGYKKDGYKKADGTADLDKELAGVRDKAARKLQGKLERQQKKMERGLDELEMALKPALGLDLSGDALADMARTWFAEAVCGLDLQQEDDLHSVRKACKTARYLAEAGEDVSKTADSVAKHFEASQEALGEWHDHLLLLGEAKATLPKGSELVEKIEAKTRRLRERADSMAKRLVAATAY